MKHNDWTWVEADCRKALELDKDSTKALCLLGLAMVESKQLSEGIKCLEKGMERSKAGKLEKYIAFTSDVFAKAKYEEWEDGAALRQNRQQELRKICERALKVEYEQAVKRLESTGKSRNHVIVIDDDRAHDISARRAQAQDYQQRSRTRKRAEYLSLNDIYKDRSCTLSEVFDKAAESNRPAELFCRFQITKHAWKSYKAWTLLVWEISATEQLKRPNDNCRTPTHAACIKRGPTTGFRHFTYHCAHYVIFPESPKADGKFARLKNQIRKPSAFS